MDQLTVPVEEEKLLAGLAHLIGIPTMFLGPLVIWAIKKDTSPFVAYHAIQAAVFHTLAWVITSAITSATCGLGFPIMFLFMGVACWIGWVAYQGQWKGYPVMDAVGRPPGI